MTHKCKSGRHVWLFKEDADKCCNGFRRVHEISSDTAKIIAVIVANLKNKKDYLIIIRVITLKCFQFILIEVKYDEDS